MGRTACTEPQCLYKGALTFVRRTRVPVRMRSSCYAMDTHTRPGIKETELGVVSFNFPVPKLGILYSMYFVFSPYPSNSTTARVNMNLS